ncbi:RHS repeat-associated core domain-containing protein, partial [Jiangella aurantiaca]|uniref:RHS repeat-associated core domain-containing protein n=1 Tax=Jiangella aurantiaca TaxID=2530373 RepID=UPI00193E429C
TLVASHVIGYDANGNRTSDVARTMDADNHGTYLDRTYAYTFDPRDRVAGVEKTDTSTGSVLSTETYVHDAASNVISQTVAGVTTSFLYDRNRLLTATSAGVVGTYNYDPFGRLDTVTSAGLVIERYTYDGFDRVATHRSLESDGSSSTTAYAYDPMDRTASRTSDAGTAGAEITEFSYLGLSGEVLSEEVAGQIQTSYQYSPWGQRLSQIKYTTDTGGSVEEDSYYGYNPHTDVETLTDTTGNTRATYGYTAYGKDDDTQFTGADAPDPGDPGAEPYNVYRFNAKRFDPASDSYDMGFRDYSPGLNRFLTRDNYNGALADLNLGLSPWTMNRYAYAGGNPLGFVELDGHRPVAIDGGGISTPPTDTSESTELPGVAPLAGNPTDSGAPSPGGTHSTYSAPWAGVRTPLDYYFLTATAMTSYGAGGEIRSFRQAQNTVRDMFDRGSARARGLADRIDELMAQVDRTGAAGEALRGVGILGALSSAGTTAITQWQNDANDPSLSTADRIARTTVRTTLVAGIGGAGAVAGAGVCGVISGGLLAAGCGVAGAEAGAWLGDQVANWAVPLVPSAIDSVQGIVGGAGDVAADVGSFLNPFD